ncbi:ataxin-7-like protein 1 isoform X1 [Latimeria chalumnae]|nr:PREDICTED: ataxin-7-like protein 1 isoform X1 [Latimeria chalumnae]|eukprot:XP_006011454.1 PREDICTED: ataxin-7-like protein 1 isoform X1 [Latimeria chalumnae]
MCKPLPSPASPSSNSRTSIVQMKPKPFISHNLVSSSSKPFKMPKDNLHTSSNKQQHTVFPSKVHRENPRVPVPVVSLEKIPNLVKADGTNVKMNSTSTTTTTTSSASSSTTPAAALVKPALTSTASKPVPPSPEKILNGKGIISPSLLDKKHQNGTKSSNKPYKRLSEREFDPNKHCGVLDPETKKPCTRSLTCKTHSLNHRRAVPGRRKQFDILLAEHKARSREKEVAKDKEHLQRMREVHQGQSTPAQESVAGSSVNCGLEPKVTSPAKSRPTNAALPRQSPANSANNLGLLNSVFIPELPINCIGGDLANRLSSDEGEMDGAEESEKLDCHYSGHHPRPLGFCTFTSHLMGRGYYVFDRRWDRFRLALNSMVEKHLNSQMWKKIPPAVDSPMPSPAAHITTAFSTSVLQPFSSPSAVYLSSSSRITPSYMMTSPMLSTAAFVTTSDTNSMSYTTAFPHGAAAFSIMDSTFKTPSLMSPVPAVIPSPSHSKPPKTKTSKSSKIKDLSSRSDSDTLSSKKKKPSSSSSSSPLQASSFSGSHKRNCVLNTSTALNSYQTTSSYNSMSVHNTNNGTNPHSAKTEPSGRTSLSSSSADSIKHMSMVVSSIDPTLSVSSLVHHSGDHCLAAHNAVSSLPLPFDKSEGKKRKNPSSNSKSSKITKMPGMNSVHKKNTANFMPPVPDTPNSAVSRQMGKSSSVSLSQSSPSTTTNPVHNRQPKVHH